MKLILAVDNNFAIGINGDMLFHLKADLERFKKITTGNIMVMGRKTLESLPGGKPLPNRTHIVLTKNKEYSNHDAIVVNSIKEINDKIKEISIDNKEVFLIGGGNLVKQLLDQCQMAYITKVNKNYDNFDTFIPNLDKLDNWQLLETSDIQSEIYKGEKLEFTYNIYINKDLYEDSYEA